MECTAEVKSPEAERQPGTTGNNRLCAQSFSSFYWPLPIPSASYGGTRADSLPSWAVCTHRHTQHSLALPLTPASQALTDRAAAKLVRTERGERRTADMHSAGSIQDSV